MQIKTKKSLLATMIILSSTLATKNINSWILIKTLLADHELTQTGISYHISLPSNFAKIALATTTTACASYMSYVGITSYIAYKKGSEQYKFLKEFQENPEYTYENLKIDAGNLYYEQCSNPNITAIESDFPVMWLFDQAAKNSKFLSFFVFIEKLDKLSKNLSEKLTFLRNHIEFKKEKKEYSDKIMLAYAKKL